ncbi:MAG: VanZ family protein [Planctomycetes bacterium]|nr:VanZ family protein [Planctomycetota bacterium]
MTAIVWRRASLAALIIYWLVLVVATHVPKVPEIKLEQGDKLVHSAAYAVLALLAAVCWSAWRSPLRKLDFLWLFAALATYAAIDEITQTPFGRQADFHDWLADLVGIACGIAAYVVVSRLSRGRV